MTFIPPRSRTERTRGKCDEQGPYTAHCTLDAMHDYSCYDASEDVSFNHRQEFTHDCGDPTCVVFSNLEH